MTEMSFLKMANVLRKANSFAFKMPKHKMQRYDLLKTMMQSRKEEALALASICQHLHFLQQHILELTQANENRIKTYEYLKSLIISSEELYMRLRKSNYIYTVGKRENTLMASCEYLLNPKDLQEICKKHTIGTMIVQKRAKEIQQLLNLPFFIIFDDGMVG